MNIKVFNDYNLVSKNSANYVAELVQLKPDSLLSFAAGDTPTGMLQELVQMAEKGMVDFSRCTFIGLDEWVGLDRHDQGSCQHYLYSHFFEPLHIEDRQIVFFDARADNLQAECRRIDRYLADHGPLDLMVVGLGMNGHIGFNEPGAHFDGTAHTVELDQVTREVGQKYFPGKAELSRGITLGIKHLVEAGHVLLQVSGEKKAPVVRQVLEGKITDQIPGSVLQKHPNCLVYLDKGAASGLQSLEGGVDNAGSGEEDN